MPVYDYMCPHCGPFTALMPMASWQDDLGCPECGVAAPRALLTVPHLATMNAAKRKAHAVNEKSAHAPESTRRTGKHPPGCGCCGKAGAKLKADAPTPMKTFPGSRPWMISH
ncbi:MAG: zinc ribbon domain-containing protein [Proteobacteria bacterium]|nr:zinc ribbon domain-containing protein [Pseudomonadota bacterium]MBU6425405.1 zinc ribbon domain-containing protein [Rhodospirillales bacterium]